jgi:hypothetical protein
MPYGMIVKEYGGEITNKEGHGTAKHAFGRYPLVLLPYPIRSRRIAVNNARNARKLAISLRRLRCSLSCPFHELCGAEGNV